MTTYTLTLLNGTKNSLNAPPTQPQPYTHSCGHTHTKIKRAFDCNVPGQPSGSPPLQIVAMEEGKVRLLTRGECEEMVDQITDALR